jgi:hypothetical protein
MKHPARRYPLLFCAILSGSLAACGSGIDKRTKKESAPIEGAGINGDSESHQVTVSLQSKEEAGALQLLGESRSFSGRIAGCESGYAVADISESTDDIHVIAGDHGCEFQLQSFSLNGEAFDVSQLSYAAGSFGVASGVDGSKLEFSVIANIADEISGDQVVRILYGVVQKGLSRSIDPSVNASIQLDGAYPLELEIMRLYMSLERGTGAPKIRVALNCAGDIAADSCMGVRLDSMKVGMKKHNPADGDLSLAQCLAIAAVGSVPSVLAVGSADAPHGGVKSAEMIGQGPLFRDNNNLQVIALSSGDQSCKYFAVEISRP